jgi:hypothetical protein
MYIIIYGTSIILAFQFYTAGNNSSCQYKSLPIYPEIFLQLILKKAIRYRYKN